MPPAFRTREDRFDLLRRGTVIPAHPLALTEERTLDERRQRGLTRYYMAAGAGGIAVGVHTTQFEIHRDEHGLYKQVLELAADEVTNGGLNRPFLTIAGICGDTRHAVGEAELAVSLGYDLGLVSFSGLDDLSDVQLIEHLREIGRIIPVFGFYLQPAVGGRTLNYDFWRDVCELDSVRAIKIAPFNRYQTLDVIRAVCDSSRKDEIALYTGNDDHILLDLLTPFRHVSTSGAVEEKYIAGGLLGQWAVWTKRAVELFDEVQIARQSRMVPPHLLALSNDLTVCNAAIFDAGHSFQGSIAGIHEVLRQQGLLRGTWCLNDRERLSPGQANAIAEICSTYKYLSDDEFVSLHIDRWLT